MANYAISGVWKDQNGEITHYAFHEIVGGEIQNITKKTKIQAVQLLDNTNNSAITIVWDYVSQRFKKGEKVNVDSRWNENYLRTNPDKTTTDNLAHLIDYGFIKL